MHLTSRSLREGRANIHSHLHILRKCDLIVLNSLGIFLLKYVRVSLCMLYLSMVIQTIQDHCKISNIINLYKVKKESSGPKASYYHPIPSNNLTVLFPKFLFFPLKKKNEVYLIYNVVFNFCWTAKWLSYTYIYIFFFIVFSIMVYYRILNIVPCAIYYGIGIYLPCM